MRSSSNNNQKSFLIKLNPNVRKREAKKKEWVLENGILEGIFVLLALGIPKVISYFINEINQKKKVYFFFFVMLLVLITTAATATAGGGGGSIQL